MAKKSFFRRLQTVALVLVICFAVSSLIHSHVKVNVPFSYRRITNIYYRSLPSLSKVEGNIAETGKRRQNISDLYKIATTLRRQREKDALELFLSDSQIRNKSSNPLISLEEKDNISAHIGISTAGDGSCQKLQCEPHGICRHQACICTATYSGPSCRNLNPKLSKLLPEFEGQFLLTFSHARRSQKLTYPTKNKPFLTLKKVLSGKVNSRVWNAMKQGNLVDIEPVMTPSMMEILPKEDNLRNSVFENCSVVGNSNRNLNFNFGREIDANRAIFRVNGLTEQQGSWLPGQLGSRATISVIDEHHLGSSVGQELRALFVESKQGIFRLFQSSFDKTDRNLQVLDDSFQSYAYRVSQGSPSLTLVTILLALQKCSKVTIYGIDMLPGKNPTVHSNEDLRYSERALLKKLAMLGAVSIGNPCAASCPLDSGFTYPNLPPGSACPCGGAHTLPAALPGFCQLAEDHGCFYNCNGITACPGGPTKGKCNSVMEEQIQLGMECTSAMAMARRKRAGLPEWALPQPPPPAARTKRPATGSHRMAPLSVPAVGRVQEWLPLKGGKERGRRNVSVTGQNGEKAMELRKEKQGSSGFVELDPEMRKHGNETNTSESSVPSRKEGKENGTVLQLVPAGNVKEGKGKVRAAIREVPVSSESSHGVEAVNNSAVKWGKRGKSGNLQSLQESRAVLRAGKKAGMKPVEGKLVSVGSKEGLLAMAELDKGPSLREMKRGSGSEVGVLLPAMAAKEGKVVPPAVREAGKPKLIPLLTRKESKFPVIGERKKGRAAEIEIRGAVAGRVGKLPGNGTSQGQPGVVVNGSRSVAEIERHLQVNNPLPFVRGKSANKGKLLEGLLRGKKSKLSAMAVHVKEGKTAVREGVNIPTVGRGRGENKVGKNGNEGVIIGGKETHQEVSDGLRSSHPLSNEKKKSFGGGISVPARAGKTRVLPSIGKVLPLLSSEGLRPPVVGKNSSLKASVMALFPNGSRRREGKGKSVGPVMATLEERGKGLPWKLSAGRREGALAEMKLDGKKG